jgi:hypothetical protein
LFPAFLQIHNTHSNIQLVLWGDRPLTVDKAGLSAIDDPEGSPESIAWMMRANPG